MAAAPTPKFSDLLSDPDQWDQPNPSYADVLNIVGGAAATNYTNVCRALINLSARSPVALAFVIEGDEDHIHVAHTPSMFPQDLINNTPFDNNMVVFVGDKIDAAVPVVLPATAFQRSAATHAFDVATIIGAAGHGAAPPVLRTGPHAAGTANTNELRVRFATLFPCDEAGTAVATHEDGRYTLVGFHNTWVAPYAAHADAAIVARWEPLRDWWRLASTNSAANTSVVKVAPVASAVPVNNQRLNAWTARQRDASLARLGVGGPGLTTAAFAQGVQDIRNTLDANQTSALEYDRQKTNKSFSDKHGDALCARIIYHILAC